MRTETREVLVKKEIYIADDGKEFEDEEDCLDYEFDKVKGELTYYDAALDEIDEPDECVFVDLRTEKDVKLCKHVFDVYGVHDGGIDEPGLYMWWETEQQWMNLDWLINHIRGGAKDV